jgi:NitT/TauT family transport system substrate-binding protein
MNHHSTFVRAAATVVSGLLLAAFAGCAPKEKTAPAPGLTQVAIQTDWYAQAEHGGFYQALAKGFYKDQGLDVDVLQGGPSTRLAETVATGRVAFAIGRSDDVMNSVSQGLPLVIVGALMQHDPQGLLLHEENPVNDFKALDGKTVMASPGAVFVQYLQSHYKIKLNIMPLNYGLAQFMADKNFIQQCFVTNEPFYVRQGGGRPKTLLLADSGLEPYRVILTSQKFARENPEVVRAFLAATFKGWADFMSGDPAPGNELILKRNENMSKELLTYAIGEMDRLKLVSGDPGKGERIGLLTRKRLREQMALMVDLKILAEPLPLEKIARFDLLPGDLQPLVGE